MATRNQIQDSLNHLGNNSCADTSPTRETSQQQKVQARQNKQMF